MSPEQQIAQMRERQDEIYENLKAFYKNEDQLILVSELANIHNVSAVLAIMGQTELWLGLSKCIAHSCAAISRIDGRPAKDIGNDIVMLGRARLQKHKP